MRYDVTTEGKKQQVVKDDLPKAEFYNI